ncbi:hypothetical protein [Maribacter sp. IgM3_T14_3]|uniref:hypothetical protein n=1 Tax=Maribacter sp. IgM3_T14_3 TaxID=3415140 RepID=UPI003C6F8B39
MTENECYILIGKLSSKFSNLEFGLSSILEHLINNTNPGIAAIITKNMQISKVIELLTKILNFNYEDDVEHVVEMKKLLNEIQGLRQKRNMFIHGNWWFQEEELEKDIVTCIDTRLKSSKNGKELSRMEEIKYSKHEMEADESKLSKLVYEVYSTGKKFGLTNLRTD